MVKVIHLLDFRIEKSDTIKTGRFLLFFVFLYLLFSSLFFVFVPLQKMEEFIAGATLSFLLLTGFQGKLVLQEPVLIQLENGVGIVISELCTGLMEMFIVASAILASIGIDWRKRIIGAIASVILLQAFNFVRIFATLLVILGNHSLQTIEFTHNILFRIFLFVVIAGSYIAWFYFSVKK